MADEQSQQTGSAPTPPAKPMDQNKIFAILGYIIPILFFLPLVTDAKHDPSARFHANQQLNLLLLEVIGQIILTSLIITAILLPVFYLFTIVLVIMGVINAVNGQMKPLPLIGKIQLIK